uniref:Large ribosomal subunit protein uL22 n=1 Tax=candidate division WWE3 bacterium TaxID=2053526 RepID=A0A7C4XT80_UNCKA
MKKAQVYAIQKYARISPKKVAVLMDLVRGKDAVEAARILKFDTTKAAKMVSKVLKSAVANARNSFNMDETKMYVAELRVDMGTSFKRGQIVARSRFNPYLKRTSHIILGLSERNKQ